MNKKWKHFLITCGIVCGVGVFFMIAGALLGGVQALDHYETEMDKDIEEVEEGIQFPDVENLEIEVANVDIYVYTTSEEYVRIDCDHEGNLPSSVRVEQQEDTLVIEGVNRSHRLSQKEEVRLYIPEDYVFQEIDIRTGAGIFEAEQLCAEELDIEVGAGTFRTEQLRILSNLEMKCGAGTIDVTVDDDEQQYDYEINCGMGIIHLGDNQFGGMGVQKQIDNDASKEMDLDCGMGTMNVSFMY